MSTNVGGVSFSVDVAGIKQSITDVKTLTKQLTNLDLSIQRLKASAKNLRVNASGTGIDLTKQTGMEKKHGQALEDNKRKTLAARRATEKLALAKTKLASKTQKAAAKVANMTARTKKLTTVVKRNSKAVQSWWSRFGTVAVGFAVVYRGIYLVQRAIVDLSSVFLRGASIMDEYNEGVATTAGMIALITTGMGGFSARFEAIGSVLREAMLHSIRLAPKFRLSVEEISVAYRELGQFGVIVTKELVEDSLVTISMIKEISASTGSTTRQIRQEIQSLFTGTARVTDQFARTIKLTMPRLFKTLQDGALSAQEKWQLLSENVAEFREAAIRANQTIRGQTQVIRNSLAVISAKALEGSGIYDAWIGRLIKFSDRLFDAEGNLGKLGKTLFNKFTAAWNALNNVLVILKEMYLLGGKLVQAYKDLPNIVHDTAMGFLKWSVALTLTTFALGTIKTLLVSLAKISGLTAVTSLFVSLFGGTKMGASASRLSSITRGLADIIIILGKISIVAFSIVATFITAVKITEELSGAFVFVYDIAKQVIPKIGILWTRMFKHAFLKGQELGERTKDFFGFAGAKEQLARVREELNTLGKRQVMPINFSSAKKKAREYVKFASVANKEAGKILLTHIASGAKDIQAVFTDAFINIKDVANSNLKNIGTADGGFVANLLNAINPLKAALDKLFSGFRRTTSLFDADTLGLGGLETNAEATFENLIERGKKAFGELSTLGAKMSNNLAGTWSKVFGGEITNTKDLFDSVMDSILKSFQDTLTDMTTAYVNIFLKHFMSGTPDSGGSNDLVSLLGNALGGMLTTMIDSSDNINSTASWSGGTSASDSASWSGGTSDTWPVLTSVNSRANGGIINEPVLGIGLHSGQPWTFGERGPETVVSNADSFKQPTVNFTLNVVNESEGQVGAEQPEPKFDGEQMIVDIVIKDYNNGGKTFNAFGGGK